ncbi:hypothetical protein D3OALGA1CA_1543 [Olavius algarvensis associated proteobacterium Delta 3]|nr:hypothetical protein D3OALGB2SA_342 [Olavius algarvensis associated proteobacterium Delta 3]CAB5102757.1 hypothetical protein D3OALGA1CA_1543 [Olavius algarvensis associated proteobacterium Delta 3]
MKPLLRKMGMVVVIVALLFSLRDPGQSQTFLSDTSTVRCSGGIVRVNDDAFRVQEQCGEPFRTFMKDGDQIWVYNFGQGRLVYYFTIFRDNLRRIQSQRCDIDNRDCLYMGR